MGSRPSDLFGTLDADALARATAEMFRAQATESPMNPWPYDAGRVSADGPCLGVAVARALVAVGDITSKTNHNTARSGHSPSEAP